MGGGSKKSKKSKSQKQAEEEQKALLEAEKKRLDEQRRAFSAEQKRLAAEQAAREKQLRAELDATLKKQADANKRSLFEQQKVINSLQGQNQRLSGTLSQNAAERRQLQSQIQANQKSFNQQIREQTNQFAVERQGLLSSFNQQLANQRTQLTDIFNVQRGELERQIGVLTDTTKTQEERINALNSAQERSTSEVNQSIADANESVIERQEVTARRRKLLSLLQRQRGFAQTSGNRLIRG